MKNLIDKLRKTQCLSADELKFLIENISDEELCYLHKCAREVAIENYGNKVFVRGLIEFTNYCKNNCYYCGIRAGNKCVSRYRLEKQDILDCCKQGYKLGFRTFVLQGGEDPFFTDSKLCDIILAIRKNHPECAITLSVGEKSYESYKAFFDAGANRFLLRHETADEIHYGKLHPKGMTLEKRKQCLFDLKQIGYQVGAGFMVGAPNQTFEDIVADLRFLQKLDPDMIGIGPFIRHAQTPFADRENGSLSLTVRLLAILRLMFPHVLLPATTALSTIAPNGRELGLKAGANVVMPNLSPVSVRKLYDLYENKNCTGEESAQCRGCLETRMESIGYRTVTARGDAVREE